MLKKSTVNKPSPLLKESATRGKSVPIAPGVNAGTGGKPAGDKRIINTETHPSKTSSTFTAPRKDYSGSVTDMGYTCISMSEGAKGNGKGNGKR